MAERTMPDPDVLTGYSYVDVRVPHDHGDGSGVHYHLETRVLLADGSKITEADFHRRREAELKRLGQVAEARREELLAGVPVIAEYSLHYIPRGNTGAIRARLEEAPGHGGKYEDVRFLYRLAGQPKWTAYGSRVSVEHLPKWVTIPRLIPGAHYDMAVRGLVGNLEFDSSPITVRIPTSVSVDPDVERRERERRERRERQEEDARRLAEKHERLHQEQLERQRRQAAEHAAQAAERDRKNEERQAEINRKLRLAEERKPGSMGGLELRGRYLHFDPCERWYGHLRYRLMAWRYYKLSGSSSWGSYGRTISSHRSRIFDLARWGFALPVEIIVRAETKYGSSPSDPLLVTRKLLIQTAVKHYNGPRTKDGRPYLRSLRNRAGVWDITASERDQYVA